MKKATIFILAIIFSLVLIGCTDKATTERTWKDDFTVAHITFEELEFDSEKERLEAILNGTAVMKHDYYVLKNKSESDFYNIYLVFAVTTANEQSVEYKQQLVGVLESGETSNLYVFYSSYEAAMDKAGIDYSDGYEVDLARIEYEIKTTT